MKFKAILIGKSTNLKAKAEALYGFINSNLRAEGILSSTALFATNEIDPNLPFTQAPTEKIELVQVRDYQAETILKALAALEVGEQADLYLFPFGALEEDISVRWAFRCNGSSLVQVKNIDWSKNEMQAKKTVYASHLLATFRMNQRPYCISLTKEGVELETIPIRDKSTVVEHDLSNLKADRQIISAWIPEEPASDLESARFLVVGGRGMGSESACCELENIAKAIGAEFGVSRPVAMNAWAPLHRLVGVSGAITKPKVCIAAAVSGAAAFYAGIANSKKIIAINSDAQAPITNAADVVIIDDYKAIMNALVNVVSKAKAEEKI